MAAGSNPRESHPCIPHAALLIACDALNARTLTVREYQPACMSWPAKQPRLHCGVVVIAPLFREKHRGAPAVRLDTDSNVSVCPIMHRHCPAGIFFKVLSRNVERVSPFRLWLQ